MRKGLDYRGVNQTVWRYFYSIYGGGPICKRGIYNAINLLLVLPKKFTKCSAIAALDLHAPALPSFEEDFQKPEIPDMDYAVQIRG